MKILIDIGHPAHVHYFRNFIGIMRNKGHRFLITARNRTHVFDLLHAYGLDYVERGTGESTISGKLLYMFRGLRRIYSVAKKFNPDLFLDFGTVYASPAAKIMRKPYIAFEDTEQARLYRMIFLPLAKAVCATSSFKANLGAKHISFNGYMELCYLHPHYFRPDPGIYDLLGIGRNERYVLLRFVSWGAGHDIGQKGLDFKSKKKLVKVLSKYARVYISSEGDLPPDLIPYQVRIPAEKMHDLQAFASLYVGEGATMASECAVLGTPAIYVNSLPVGYLTEQEEKYQLVVNFRNSRGVLEKAEDMISQKDLKQEWRVRRLKMLSEKIDVTAFMVWFVENFPQSMSDMKADPDCQSQFKISYDLDVLSPQ